MTMTGTLADAPRLIDDGAELPAEIALNVYRGDNRSWVFRLWADAEQTIPYSLVQVTEVTAQIRRTPDDRTAVVLRTQVTQPNYVFCHLDPAQSAICPSGRWDLQLTFPGSRVLTVIRGPVTVTPDVTR
jgi:hypothetical protein